MTAKTWSLEKAKNALSAVVAAAERGQPQLVTKRGKPAVYVVAAADFERLLLHDEAPGKTLGELLLSAPKRPEWMADDEELFPREPFVDTPDPFGP
jgi:prevent-host-death family protein